MFETKCYRQNDRSDRVIISWFWWKSEFGMVLTSQIYVLYTKHNLPIFFIIDLFLCKLWKIQALLPLRSCRRRSVFPPKGDSWKKQHVISEKMRLYLWIQPPELPGGVPGRVIATQGLSSTMPAHKNKPLGTHLQIPLIQLIPLK